MNPFKSPIFIKTLFLGLLSLISSTLFSLTGGYGESETNGDGGSRSSSIGNGAFFLDGGSNYVIRGNFTSSSNSVTAGQVGKLGAGKGASAGQDVFFVSTASITLDPNGGLIDFKDSIVDDSCTSMLGDGTHSPGTGVGATLVIGQTSSAAGTVFLETNNAYGNGTILNNGILKIGANESLGPYTNTLFFNHLSTLQAGSANLVVSNQITLNSKANFDSNNTILTLVGPILGACELLKIGSGTLILSNLFNNYSGGTTILSGILQMGRENVMPFSGLVTASGGATVYLNNFNQTIGNLSGSGSVILGSAQLTFGDSTNQTFSGVISGAGSLVKTGTGEVTLSGANTFIGGTSLYKGSLSLKNNAALGTGFLTMSDGTLLDLHNGVSINNLVSFSGAEQIQVLSGSVILNGTISGSGSLNKVGGGILGLFGSNTYSGGTLLSSGTLNLGNDSALGTGNVTMSNETALILQPGISVSNAIVLNKSSTAEVDSGIGTLSGVLSGGSGSLTKTGKGTLSLTNANSYGEGTFLSNGTLEIANNLALSTGSLSMSSGTTLKLKKEIFLSNPITLSGKDTALVSSGTATLSGVLSGSGSLSKTGKGTLVLSEMNTYKRGTRINKGTLLVNGSLSSKVKVGKGTLLAGNGKIDSNLNVFGTVHPGNFDIGKLITKGPVKFQKGSTYSAEFKPKKANLLKVKNKEVFIKNGSKLELHFDKGPYAKKTYTIIKSKKTIRGKFTKLSVNKPFLHPKVAYKKNAITVTIQKGKITSTGTSKFINDLAYNFDEAKTLPGTDFDYVLNELYFVPDAHLVAEALNRMQPSQLMQHLSSAGQNNTGRLLSQITARNDQLDRSSEYWSSWANENLTGMEKTTFSNFQIGMGAGQLSNHVNWDAGQGNVSSNCGFVYGKWTHAQLFVDAILTAAFNQYASNRRIEFMDIHRNASSSYHGYASIGKIASGWQFNAVAVNVTPFVSIHHQWMYQNAFKEKGAQSLNFAVYSQNVHLIRGESGIKLKRAVEGSWRPSVQVSFIREMTFGQNGSKARLDGLENAMKSKPANVDRTVVSPAVGMKWTLAQEKLDISTDYSGEFDLSGKSWRQKGEVKLEYFF